MKKFLTVPLVLAGAMTGGNALASPLYGVFYAGGTVSKDPSAYAGVTRALPGGMLGKGLAFKTALSGGAYRYDSGAEEISARYYSGHVGIVYQKSGEWGWANVGAGPRFTQTDLTPDDPANTREGFRVDALISTDGAINPDGLRVSWYAETGVRDRSYVAKVQLTHHIDKEKKWRAGVEGLFQGDRYYDRQGAGVVVAAKVRDKMEVQFSGGATFQSGRGEEPYFSISLNKLF